MSRTLPSLCLAALIGLAWNSAQAEETWLLNGRTAGPDSSRAVADGFAVMQIATPDPQGLMTAWNRPGDWVSITTTNQIARNKPIVTFIVFRGCKAGPTGACNVTAEFEVFDPAGKVYAKQQADIWVGRPPPPAKAIELSEGGMGLVIEDKDPLGVYRVSATITDNVAGKTLRTESTIEATAK